MTSEGLDSHADQEAKHGESAVEAFGTLQFRVSDLLRGRFQEPGVIGLGRRTNRRDGAGHEQECLLEKRYGTSQGLDVLLATCAGLMSEC